MCQCNLTPKPFFRKKNGLGGEREGGRKVQADLLHTVSHGKSSSINVCFSQNNGISFLLVCFPELLAWQDPSAFFNVVVNQNWPGATVEWLSLLAVEMEVVIYDRLPDKLAASETLGGSGGRRMES